MKMMNARRENNRRHVLTILMLLFFPVLVYQAVAVSDEGTINFNFDQVDVQTFVRLVGDITGKQFVVAEGLNRKITVVSPKVSRDDVYPLFLSILQSAGCTVAKEGDIYRIVALTEATAPMGKVVIPSEAIPAEGMVTRIFHLDHVSAIDLREALMPMVGGGKEGAVGVVKDTNHLIITDTAESIRRIEKIINEINQPGMAKSTEILPLEFVAAEEMAEQLNTAMAESESRGNQLKMRLPQASGYASVERTGPAVVAAPHSNSLILVGTTSQIEDLKRIIKQMDIDSPSGRGRLNAIFLRYISAAETAKSINALLQKSVEAGKDATQRKKIAIESIEANNAILVDASPGDFECVKKLVEQLDIISQQVHIEVLIAEINASDSFDIGVEMAAVEMPSKVGSSVVQGASRMSSGPDSLMDTIQKGIFPAGLTVGVAHGSRLDSEGKVVSSYPGVININAVKQNNKVKIRSETALETQNNKEASVLSVNEIPVLKSTIEGGSGTARDVIQNIDRIDVGIKLKLTPHVIPGNEVQMDIKTGIEAVIDSVGQDSLTPIIAKREVVTSVIVPDGEIIVIAGLTREDKTKKVRKIPILGSIPLIGWLFRHTVDVTEKTNVLIFVTPRILASKADTENVMKNWQEKTGLRAYEEK